MLYRYNRPLKLSNTLGPYQYDHKTLRRFPSSGLRTPSATVSQLQGPVCPTRKTPVFTALSSHQIQISMPPSKGKGRALDTVEEKGLPRIEASSTYLPLGHVNRLTHPAGAVTTVQGTDSIAVNFALNPD